MCRKLILASFATILFTVSARADVITSGFATLTPFNPITQMQFSGAGFSVSATGNGFGGGGFLPCMGGCSAGSSLTLSAQSGFWGFSDVFGSMRVNGTLFTFVFQATPTLPQVVGTGNIGFVGDSVVVPITEDPFVTLTAPFTATNGFLRGSAVDGNVAVSFAGSGVATLTLRNLGNGQFIATNITYSFVQPVPEPATLILLTTGLIGGAARYVRCRRRQSLRRFKHDR